MADRSSHYRLIEAKLNERGQDFASYIAAQRNARQSWRAIARDITARTDVEVTGEGLRKWFADKLTVVVKDGPGRAA